MISADEPALRTRVHAARDRVFGPNSGAPLLLREEVLDQFQLGKREREGSNEAPENSHLSLLAMVDCWAALGINPFEHLAVAATPVFRLWIGIAQTLFLNGPRLEKAIKAGVEDVTYR